MLIFIILLICLLIYLEKRRQRDRLIREQYLEIQRQAEIHKKYESFANEHSIAIKQLRKINEKYNFRVIPSFDMEKSYDSDFNYDNVSTRDYLIYRLVYIRKDVLQAISDTAENKRLHEVYKNIIANNCALGQYDTTELLEDEQKLREIEKKLFNSLVKKPKTEFYISVILINTNRNDFQHASKTDAFNSEEIKDIIIRLGYKNGDFYLDEEIWQAICRVERGRVSNKMRFSIYERDGHRCKKCGSRYDLEIDHIFPVSKGGKSTYENLQTLCHDCNIKKSNTIERGAIDPRARHKYAEEICPNCKINLVLIKGKYGDFYGCPNYPKCKYTKQK